MATNGSADRGQVQGMIVKIKPQGDGTLRFDVVFHHANGKICHREKLYLPPDSFLKETVVTSKGRLARVEFEKTGRERDKLTNIVPV